jgi:hypothetical protein
VKTYKNKTNGLIKNTETNKQTIKQAKAIPGIRKQEPPSENKKQIFENQKAKQTLHSLPVY